jgi:hypothetical protein
VRETAASTSWHRLSVLSDDRHENRTLNRVSPDQPQRPFRDVPVVGAASAPAPARHHTVLPAEPEAALDDLRAALTATDDASRQAAITRVAAEHPAFLEAWARLSELSLANGDAVAAYAFARVAYHRGLDRLRREGWGGTGIVRWAEPSNRGFLRGLRALLAAAAALGEEDESARCRTFLLELDPDDTLNVATYPEVPGRDWVPPTLP